jgi:hypothetical protein
LLKPNLVEVGQIAKVQFFPVVVLGAAVAALTIALWILSATSA